MPVEPNKSVSIPIIKIEYIQKSIPLPNIHVAWCVSSTPVPQKWPSLLLVTSSYDRKSRECKKGNAHTRCGLTSLTSRTLTNRGALVGSQRLGSKDHGKGPHSNLRRIILTADVSFGYQG